GQVLVSEQFLAHARLNRGQHIAIDVVEKVDPQQQYECGARSTPCSLTWYSRKGTGCGRFHSFDLRLLVERFQANDVIAHDRSVMCQTARPPAPTSALPDSYSADSAAAPC